MKYYISHESLINMLAENGDEWPVTLDELQTLARPVRVMSQREYVVHLRPLAGESSDIFATPAEIGETPLQVLAALLTMHHEALREGLMVVERFRDEAVALRGVNTQGGEG
jgi:hypothetical protein